MATLKRSLKSLAAFLGWEVRRLDHLDRVVAEHPRHERVRPGATYAPWRSDDTFIKLFETIRTHTLVDKYRCYELWTLVEQTAKLDGALLEVGVWRGGTGALIAKKASLCRIVAPVYLCDTFRGVVKASPHDSTYRGGEHADTSRATAERLLGSLHLTNVKILEGIFPDETGHVVTDQRFRFCHIDVDVYQSAKDIVDWMWGRLAVGGVLVYDDFGFAGCDGVTRLVEEQRSRRDRLIIHNLNGHAITIKIR